MDDVELGRVLSDDFSVEKPPPPAEETDALDSIFTSAERMCCAKDAKEEIVTTDENGIPVAPGLAGDVEGGQGAGWNPDAVLSTSPTDDSEDPPLPKEQPFGRAPSNVSEAFEMKAEYPEDNSALKKKQMAVKSLSNISAPIGMAATTSRMGRWLSLSRSSTTPGKGEMGMDLPSPEVDTENENLPADEPVEDENAGSVAVSSASTAVIENKASFPYPEMEFDLDPSDPTEEVATRPRGLARFFKRGKNPSQDDAGVDQFRSIAEIDESAMEHPGDDEVPQKSKTSFGSFLFRSAAAREAKSTSPPAEPEPESSTKNAVEIEAHFDGDEGTIMSDNAQNTTMEESGMVGTFLDEEDLDKGVAGPEKDQQTKRSFIRYALGAMLLLIILIGSLAGLLARQNKNGSSASRSFSNAGVGSGPNSIVTQAPTTSPTFGTTSNQAPASTATTSGPVDGGVSTDPPTDSLSATDAPSDGSTATEEPSSSLTECVDSIEVDNECYSFGQDEISVSFVLCNETSQDWVGLYPSDSDIDNLDFPDDRQWQFSCGSQDCNEPIAIDTISMGSDTPPGRYRAFLFSNEDGDQGAPYFGIASSQVFRVKFGACD